MILKINSTRGHTGSLLVVTIYTEFVLYYTMLIVLNKFDSIQFKTVQGCMDVHVIVFIWNQLLLTIEPT